MKNLKLILALILAGIFTITSLYLTSCSDSSNPLGSGYPGGNLSGDKPGNGVTVKVVEKDDGYHFIVTNNMKDSGIINDFHIQLIEPKGKIIGNANIASCWKIDSATTDKSKGKIGVKGQEPHHGIQYRHSLDVFWIKISYNSDARLRFVNWQATRNGKIMDKGTELIPND